MGAFCAHFLVLRMVLPFAVFMRNLQVIVLLHAPSNMSLRGGPRGRRGNLQHRNTDNLRTN